MTAQQYCQEKVLRQGSSLYYSLRFLPIELRETLLALHAFFSEISDIRYECHDTGVALLKFQWWQEEMAQTFAGTPHHPICQALSEPIRHYQLAEHYFQEIIEGFLLDLKLTRYATFDELEDYCKRTSSVLNLLCTHVLGYQNETTLKYAEQLGIALQLTYILRELRPDILKGRLYIPQEELVRFKVSEQSLFNRQLDDTVQALFAYQATRIRAYYHNAFKYLSKKDRFNQRSGLIRAQLALATLQEIENDGFQLFKHRIHLTPLRKLWITWRTIWKVRMW
jgi:phytoene synthase